MLLIIFNRVKTKHKPYLTLLVYCFIFLHEIALVQLGVLKIILFQRDFQYYRTVTRFSYWSINTVGGGTTEWHHKLLILHQFA